MTRASRRGPKTSGPAHLPRTRLNSGVPGLDEVLIITDWRMPRMDGDELIARVRAVPGFEDTPILSMSANQLEHHEPYMRKPFEVDRLLELVQQLLA
jgi:CheY-like chemotaxis protein